MSLIKRKRSHSACHVRLRLLLQLQHTIFFLLLEFYSLPDSFKIGDNESLTLNAILKKGEVFFFLLLSAPGHLFDLERSLGFSGHRKCIETLTDKGQARMYLNKMD